MRTDIGGLTDTRTHGHTGCRKVRKLLVDGGVLGGNKLSFVHVEKKRSNDAIKVYMFCVFTFSASSFSWAWGSVLSPVAGALCSVPMSLMMIYCFDCNLAEKKIGCTYIYVYIYDSGSR